MQQSFLEDAEWIGQLPEQRWLGTAVSARQDKPGGRLDRSKGEQLPRDTAEASGKDCGTYNASWHGSVSLSHLPSIQAAVSAQEGLASGELRCHLALELLCSSKLFLSHFIHWPSHSSDQCSGRSVVTVNSSTSASHFGAEAC